MTITDRRNRAAAYRAHIRSLTLTLGDLFPVVPATGKRRMPTTTKRGPGRVHVNGYSARKAVTIAEAKAQGAA